MARCTVIASNLGCWFIFIECARQASACTTLVVGKGASADGSVIVTHSDDAESNPDARLCWVAAADHPEGSLRPVYYDTENFPRYVGHSRGRGCYEPAPGQEPSPAIGHIPQVEHTYAFFEATYGLVNEHGLGIGESTCSAVFGTNAAGYGGKALLSIDELSRLAMERTNSSRAAVKLMGALAEEYGFYGVGSFEGSAESLMVGDPDEAFIFHILPDPTGISAIWAAQRVPDDHVGVVANMFVIREIDFNDPLNFLFSESVRSVAIEKRWWCPSCGPLDFTAIYSDGEYDHKFYSGRRVWGAYRMFGVDLPDSYTNLKYDTVYPVTTKPGKGKISVEDLFVVHRDYYKGSKYDMTQGLAAGPWADPDRWSTTSKMNGNWERSIGIFRTSETHVVQSRRQGQGSILWYAPHAPSTSVFIPLVATATAVPAPYSVADPNHLSRQSAYWAHRYIFNIVKLKYNHMMKDVIALQSRLEHAGFDIVRKLDAATGANASSSARFFDDAYAAHAEHVVNEIWAMPDKLIEKFADGWLNDGEPLGYPDDWLKAAGYQNGPPPPPKGATREVKWPRPLEEASHEEDEPELDSYMLI